MYVFVTNFSSLQKKIIRLLGIYVHLYDNTPGNTNSERRTDSPQQPTMFARIIIPLLWLLSRALTDAFSLRGRPLSAKGLPRPICGLRWDVFNRIMDKIDKLEIKLEMKFEKLEMKIDKIERTIDSIDNMMKESTPLWEDVAAVYKLTLFQELAYRRGTDYWKGRWVMEYISDFAELFYGSSNDSKKGPGK